MKLRTNNWIVGKVNATYNVLSLVRYMILNSVEDHTDWDLVQYIYMYLLNMDNEKLNQMYNDGVLRNFISSMIRNQRNNPNVWYHKTFSRSNMVEIDTYDSPDVEQTEDNFDDKLDFILQLVNESNQKWYVTGLTQCELRYITSISMLDMYYVKNISKKKICELTKTPSISTINLLLRDGKRYLREEWEVKDCKKWVNLKTIEK